MKQDLLIKNCQIYQDRFFITGAVGVNHGKITVITTRPQEDAYYEVVDLEGKYLLPGAIESHMHVREPGRPDRGTFLTETQAAAGGGVTTILEHPIANPPQYKPEILERRIEDATNQCVVDFAFYGAAGAEFPEEVARMGRTGIVSFKTFLHKAPEGRDSEFIGLTMANDGEMLLGFEQVARTGKLSTVHAENNDMIQTLIDKYRQEGKTSPIHHAKSRPKLAEYETVGKLIALAKETGNKFVFAHISTPEAMELIKTARADGLECYVETCPQYLFFTEEELYKHGPYAKCNPPLRKAADVKALWKYVLDGTVDFIGSDHATYTIEEKETGQEDIFKAPAGFIGVDMRVPLMLNAVNEKRLPFAKAVDLMSRNIAQTFGMYPQKGTITVGSDADFMVVDMDRKYTVDMDNSPSKARKIGKIYNGLELQGKVLQTFVRGKSVMKDDQVDDSHAGWGRLIEVYDYGY